MGYLEGKLFGVNARIFRISFSGELAYEINVPSDYGMFMWEKIIEIGEEFNIQPYGTEALSTLRIEMGHVAGPELDGRTIPYDVSLEGLVSIETRPSSETSYGIVLPSSSGPATCPISILRVDKASVP